VEGRRARVAAHEPARLLARGWSITHTADGVLVKAPADAPAGTVLRTTTAGGDVSSTSHTGEVGAP
jgi:exonuclease VII large subunit